MTNLIARYLIPALVALGIVMPQASAALAGIGLAGGQIIVICTGDELRHVRIDQDGNPVEMPDEVMFCALLHAVDTGSNALLAENELRLLYVDGLLLDRTYPYVFEAFSQSLPRAPPVV